MRPAAASYWEVGEAGLRPGNEIRIGLQAAWQHEADSSVRTDARAAAGEEQRKVGDVAGLSTEAG